MDKFYTETAKKFGINLDKMGLGSTDDLESEYRKASGETPAAPKDALNTDGSLSRVLMGEIGYLSGIYFPPEMIGGCCPRVAGEEEQIVWHAAAEATDSERIKVIWQAQGDKIWYLAVQSSDLASHPGTWCPFAALLPGLKDAEPLPACYIYYSDETAVMMTVTADSLQIHRGTPSVLRLKAERTIRELGERMPIIDLIPEILDHLTPVPWSSLSLFEDRSRRIFAVVSILAALFLTIIAGLVWLLVAMTTVTIGARLDDLKARTREKTISLMSTVQSLRASPMREQLATFADLNDALLNMNGYLDFYAIGSDKKVLWRAVLPSNITSGRITEDLRGQTLDITPKGVVVGNNREALTYKQRGR